MSHYPSSSKKVAVLTGLTMLVSGAEISSADAATTIPEVEFFGISASGGGDILNFNQFNQPGTLTGVVFELNSSIFIDTLNLSSLTASVSIPGTTLFSQNFAGPFGPSQTPLGTDPLFIGGGEFPVNLLFQTVCESGPCSGEGWSGALTVAYTFDPPSETPLPAALPLFATGVAGLAVMGLRKRRKQKAKEQA
jgi:hypothetical protein